MTNTIIYTYVLELIIIIIFILVILIDLLIIIFNINEIYYISNYIKDIKFNISICNKTC